MPCKNNASQAIINLYALYLNLNTQTKYRIFFDSMSSFSIHAYTKLAFASPNVSFFMCGKPSPTHQLNCDKNVPCENKATQAIINLYACIVTSIKCHILTKAKLLFNTRRYMKLAFFQKMLAFLMCGKTPPTHQLNCDKNVPCKSKAGQAIINLYVCTTHNLTRKQSI